MRSAHDRHRVNYPVDNLQTLHDNRQSIPDLFCDHIPCSCTVRFVPRSQQNRANRIEPIDIPAYIGLTSSSEHITGCRYDAAGKITAIVAQSDPNFLKALDDGKRELRLLALHNGLRAAVFPATRLCSATHQPRPTLAEEPQQTSSGAKKSSPAICAQPAIWLHCAPFASPTPCSPQS